jgi:2-enoate reductase
LNTEVTAELVKRENPDVVVLATGSYPIVPDIPGVDKDIVVPVSEILFQEGPLPKESVVVGGGPTGCEVALHLAESGSKVIIVEMLSKIGNGLESITRKVLLNKLIEHNVRFLTDSVLERIEDNGVWVKSKGKEEFIPAERVIISIGNRPDTRLYEQIKDMKYEIYQIGDCLEPRSAKTAIYEGTVLGLSI